MINALGQFSSEVLLNQKSEPRIARMTRMGRPQLLQCGQFCAAHSRHSRNSRQKNLRKNPRNPPAVGIQERHSTGTSERGCSRSKTSSTVTYKDPCDASTMLPSKLPSKLDRRRTGLLLWRAL